jgi:hypothetical protein
MLARRTAHIFEGRDWRWFAAAGLLAIVLAAPFALVDVPPVLDYPNHLARYFVLAHPDDPILSLMYAPHWGIQPNLGMDILGAAMLRMTDAYIGVYAGGKILLALSLFAPVIGVMAYHRVAFGRASYWPLGAGLVAYNGVFFLGFMNFLLSLGLALIAGAGWIALRRRNFLLTRIAAGALATAVIFFCHILGTVLFAVLIGADEASLLWKRLSSGSLKSKDLAGAAGTVAAALSPAVILYCLSPLNARADSVGDWRGIAKIWRILTPFMTTSAELTLATALAVVALLILFRRQLTFAPGVPLALAGLVLAFVACPSSMKGGAFIDMRFALMIALLLFAGIQPSLSTREAMLASVVVAALIMLRSGYVATSWLEHRHDLADLRAAIAHVQPGARVLAARGHPGDQADLQPANRALPGIYRLDGHLAGLLVIERRAFWPLLFADPAQQPLAVRPPFDRIAEPMSEPVEWQWIAQDTLPAEALQRAPYLEQWQRKFDDVLLIDRPATTQSSAALSPVYRGSYAELYRIDHKADPASVESHAEATGGAGPKPTTAEE